LREVREEAGLHVVSLGPLAYSMQAIDPRGRAQVIAYVFEVDEWQGTPAPADPEGVVTDAQWFNVPEAIRQLQSLPWHSMREPLLSYLRAECAPGTVWMYSVGGEHESNYVTLTG